MIESIKPKCQSFPGVGNGLGLRVAGGRTAGQFGKHRRPAFRFRIQFNQQPQFHGGKVGSTRQPSKRREIKATTGFAFCTSLAKPRALHRGAMPEGSRGLSDRRKRYPRKACHDFRIPEGCQRLCDPARVVEHRASSGGIVTPRRGSPQPPANFWQPGGLTPAQGLKLIKLKAAKAPSKKLPERSQACRGSSSPVLLLRSCFHNSREPMRGFLSLRLQARQFRV